MNRAELIKVIKETHKGLSRHDWAVDDTIELADHILSLEKKPDWEGHKLVEQTAFDTKRSYGGFYINWLPQEFIGKRVKISITVVEDVATDKTR